MEVFMHLNPLYNISFKSYIPIVFYAKNPENGSYSRITSRENIRKCQSFVVRNLNGTAKSIKNQKFVEFYKSHDKDYAQIPKVHSVYDNKNPVVYMVTGKDTDIVESLAKDVGKTKSKSIEIIGNSKSFESKNAARSYFSTINKFLKNTCKRVKSKDGHNLSLVMYFKPSYGKKSGKFNGFEFFNAQFLKRDINQFF